jgi:flagellar basal body-associated protein FliL
MKDKWFYVKILCVVILCAIVFWALAVCAYQWFGFNVIEAQDIVLTLVGILATFVVISNYAQVQTIKQDFEKNISDIERNCKKLIEENEQKLANEINEIEKRLKDKLVLSNKIDSYMPKFNAYRALIDAVFMSVDLWKAKDVIKQYNFFKSSNKKEELKQLANTEGNDFLSLYKAYQFISKEYQRDIMSESVHRMPSLNEIEQYKINANWIWYANDRMRNILVKQINSNAFNDVSEYEKERLQDSLSNLNNKCSTNYLIENLSIDLIAQISGDVECDILAPLIDLIIQYNSKE